MNDFWENLKRQAQENPVIALAAGGALLTGVTRLFGAVVDLRNSRAWAKEVARRTMKDGLKK